MSKYIAGLFIVMMLASVLPARAEDRGSPEEAKAMASRAAEYLQKNRTG